MGGPYLVTIQRNQLSFGLVHLQLNRDYELSSHGATRLTPFLPGPGKIIVWSSRLFVTASRLIDEESSLNDLLDDSSCDCQHLSALVNTYLNHGPAEKIIQEQRYGFLWPLRSQPVNPEPKMKFGMIFFC